MEEQLADEYIRLLDVDALAKRLSVSQIDFAHYQAVSWTYSFEAFMFYRQVCIDHGKEKAEKMARMVFENISGRVVAPVDENERNEMLFYELCAFDDYHSACGMFVSLPVFGAFAVTGGAIRVSTVSMLAGKGWTGLLLCCVHRAKICGFHHQPADVFLWADPMIRRAKLSWVIYMQLFEGQGITYYLQALSAEQSAWLARKMRDRILITKEDVRFARALLERCKKPEEPTDAYKVALLSPDHQPVKLNHYLNYVEWCSLRTADSPKNSDIGIDLRCEEFRELKTARAFVPCSGP